MKKILLEKIRIILKLSIDSRFSSNKSNRGHAKNCLTPSSAQVFFLILQFFDFHLIDILISMFYFQLLIRQEMKAWFLKKDPSYGYRIADQTIGNN